MEDLQAFTRDLVKQMERDLGTRLAVEIVLGYTPPATG